MSRNINSLFNIKNGRKFYHALKIAAQDEPHIGMMFVDNLENNVNRHIEEGHFKLALDAAFVWDDSNEKGKFWINIHRNLKDLEGAEKTVLRRLNMADNYDEKYPILSFRVSKEEKETVNKIVEERSKWEDKFSRQKYLYRLLEKELKGLGLI